MDTDLSHEAIQRFDSIEERLRKLEGDSEETEVVEEDQTDEVDDDLQEAEVS